MESRFRRKSRCALLLILLLFASRFAAAQTAAPAQAAKFTFYVYGGGLHPNGVKSLPAEKNFAALLSREMASQPYATSVTLEPATFPDQPYVALDSFIEPINDHTYVIITTIFFHFAGDKYNRYHGAATSIVDTALTGGVGTDSDPEVPISVTAAVQHARIFLEHELHLRSGDFN